MMKVGFIGLGKLGLPVALASEAAGHEVIGFDPSPAVQDYLAYGKIPYQEDNAQELLDRSHIELVAPTDIAAWADIIFIAVQTPHQPEFEGVTRLPAHRADFDYTYLRDAVFSVASAECPVVVISTVLPGTMEREIKPLISEEKLLYNPFFIAMGTTIPDFVQPELILVGTDHAQVDPLRRFYDPIHSQFARPEMFVTTIRTAELTKVAYNTFISMKIVFANAMMELCEKTGADVDDLVDALSLGTQRLLSPAYLRGGMGDGGGCHPRDNIALSWLARECNLSYDLFAELMVARERQTEWLADLILEEQNSTSEYRPITILGKAYKPETNLTIGSASRLLAELLRERAVEFVHEDEHVDGE